MSAGGAQLAHWEMDVQINEIKCKVKQLYSTKRKKRTQNRNRKYVKKEIKTTGSKQNKAGWFGPRLHKWAEMDFENNDFWYA